MSLPSAAWKPTGRKADLALHPMRRFCCTEVSREALARITEIQLYEEKDDG